MIPLHVIDPSPLDRTVFVNYKSAEDSAATPKVRAGLDIR
jgi:hypothetical protein